VGVVSVIAVGFEVGLSVEEAVVNAVGFIEGLSDEEAVVNAVGVIVRDPVDVPDFDGFGVGDSVGRKSSNFPPSNAWFSLREDTETAHCANRTSTNTTTLIIGVMVEDFNVSVL
jgi:hypothetical protein